MLSDSNSVKLQSDHSPPVQWCKVAAHEDEKTKLVFKRYSQVSVIVTATQRTAVLPQPGQLQNGCRNHGMGLPQTVNRGLSTQLSCKHFVEPRITCCSTCLRKPK